MEKYLYVFGYETPCQKKSNKLYDRGDEDSEGFFILAENKKNVIKWGDRVANKFLQILYNNKRITLKKLGFCGFILEDKDDIESSEKAGIQTLKIGEYPNLNKIIKRKYGKKDRRE